MQKEARQRKTKPLSLTARTLFDLPSRECNYGNHSFSKKATLCFVSDQEVCVADAAQVTPPKLQVIFNPPCSSTPYMESDSILAPDTPSHLYECGPYYQSHDQCS